ncbi:hypothetical protein HF086_003320 [Spodoptera exigua]|uniref:Cadherin domain-containing protein n=1 Tax=Spodoptera exigua TaxID=7107 RepID=A0A922SP87_SPOEX|nr:hypothetical protein HF086_003320 [Spodoptera exigua]
MVDPIAMHRYTFIGNTRDGVPVHITVTDVNEFAPVFSQSAYVKSVDEGRIYDEILRVEAIDRDCTPRYGDVCKYEILTDRSQPFTIDNEGVIRNTEALDYEKSHNHILSVVAYDCGMMQSAPVMVTIKVNKPCRAGWKGLDPKTIDLLPSPGVGNEWAKSLKPDSVPESVLPHALLGTFSISTWMRHAPPPDNDKHRKEHVLCLADDHSTESDMKHHLRGWLAGLGVARGALQPARALACLAHCREGLSLAPDLYLKSVSVEGDGVADVETLLRRVAYGDARAFPTPGRRNVHVATTITCDNGRMIKARPAESYIMVLAPQTPSILLNGSEDLARDYTHFRSGLTVFPDLAVRVLAGGNGHPMAEASQKLDSCVVSVYPALNPDHEALSLRAPADLPLRYDIRAAVTRDGVILSGADTVHNYQKVLRDIVYSNKKPAYYLNRVFKLTCSELNGRFTSNEYVQTLTVVHPHMSGASEAGLAREMHPSGMADKMDAVARDKQSEHGSRGGHALSPRVYAAHAQREAHAADVPAPRLIDLREHAPSNHVALLIGVVSCGVLVVVGGVALARARASRSRPAPPAPPRPPPRCTRCARPALTPRWPGTTPRSPSPSTPWKSDARQGAQIQKHQPAGVGQQHDVMRTRSPLPPHAAPLPCFHTRHSSSTNLLLNYPLKL